MNARCRLRSTSTRGRSRLCHQSEGCNLAASTTTTTDRRRRCQSSRWLGFVFNRTQLHLAPILHHECRLTDAGWSRPPFAWRKLENANGRVRNPDIRDLMYRKAQNSGSQTTRSKCFTVDACIAKQAQTRINKSTHSNARDLDDLDGRQRCVAKNANARVRNTLQVMLFCK